MRPCPTWCGAWRGCGSVRPYLLDDMADDGFGLLDRLGIEAAHMVGASMAMAISRPERVLSLTPIMSTSGERRAGRPKLRVWSLLFRRAPHSKDAYVEYFVRVFRMIGSKGFEVRRATRPRTRRRLIRTGHHAAGTGRQLAAIIASGDRTEQLRDLRVPTTVIHGKDDPLIPFSGGMATARAVPGAKLIAIPGMGHDLPRELWPVVVDSVVEMAARPAAAA
jgi:pimeloyl-ACP methyl ester carboxylesterase